jgi:asparagine synthase (glutamine-hydrolysing)
MCGIAGLIAPELATAERLHWVQVMTARLGHRGPSGDALWADDRCALGLARLAIVAPGRPARVLADESGGVVGVANGEIYNHEALRLGLLARGHALDPGPDTAVLPHLYEERGDELPGVLDGMFALALWDRTLGALLLARDRAGEKPLFIAGAGGRLAFASEPAALLALPWVGRDPAPEALARYLVHGCFAGEDCAWSGIRQLPPAHTLHWRADRSRVRRYWRPWDAVVRAGSPGAADATPEQAAERLAEAVASRVPAEVPFGVFLSGGVDSGLVATLAARAGRGPFPTFSLRLPHRGYDESGFAARVARAIGASHHVLTMTEREGEEALESWAARMDQPLGDPSVLPTWALARLAARQVPVVLTGEGGDELFAGYPTYLGHRHAALVQRLPGPVAAAMLALARRLRPRHHHVTLAHLLERFLASRGLAPFERHLAWWGTARATDALALLHPALRARVAASAPLAHATRLEAQLRDMGVVTDARTPLVAYQILDFETYLSGDLLTKVDRCTMAHGVESRAPFLRPSLVEWALTLPEEARLRGRTGKWALKQAARTLLPADLLARRKQGFSPPFSAWARGPWRGLVLDRLSADRVERAGVLDAAAVQRLLREHLDGREDRGRALWAVLSLQAWGEHWLHGAAGRAPAATRTEVEAGV